VETLETSSHPDIINWAVRLLEVLLTRCSLPVTEAFVDNNGINAVLRAAKAGNVDSRRLQIDSLRTLCAFIGSSTALHKDGSTDNRTILNAQFDLVFQSEFFETLCSVVGSRRWWLFEISGHWMPSLVHLCHLRPHESVWKMVVKVFRDFAERNVGEDGYMETLSHLDVISDVATGKQNGMVP
jgi:hypothetical protein